jgi:hypothetical protein
LCTDSRSMLLNPGIAPRFGCPNQPLNIPEIQLLKYKSKLTFYIVSTGIVPNHTRTIKIIRIN